RSPPPPLGRPLLAWHLRQPSSMTQPLVGKASPFQARQASVVVPSKRSLKPADFSSAVRPAGSAAGRGSGAAAAANAGDPLHMARSVTTTIDGKFWLKCIW